LFVIMVACAPPDSGEAVKGKARNDRPSSTDPLEKTPQSTSTQSALSAPMQDPVLGAKISSPRQVDRAAPFTAQVPLVRANDFHAAPVTGKDCMTCHGGGGPAPHFAYGGTIALGYDWTWAPAGSGAGGGGGSDYGDDDDDDYDYGYSDDDDYGYGGDDDDDDYGYGGDDDDDDYGYGGGGGGARKGYPADRTHPSTYTEIRIVGSDRYVYDTVTDFDGNFWFKSPSEVAVPAYTGVRYNEFVVTGSTNGIACGSCHESTAPGGPGRLWTWEGKPPTK
jgi:hypothetical protein